MLLMTAENYTGPVSKSIKGSTQYVGFTLLISQRHIAPSQMESCTQHTARGTCRILSPKQYPDPAVRADCQTVCQHSEIEREKTGQNLLFQPPMLLRAFAGLPFPLLAREVVSGGVPADGSRG